MALDWSLNFNGLDLGAETAYVLESLSGLHDPPDIRTSDQNRARAHGQIAGTDYLGGRSIQANFTVYFAGPTDDADVIVQAFSQALVAGMPESPLQVQIPGLAGGRLVQMDARVRRIRLDIDEDYRVGAGRAAVEWWATDPRIYDADPTTVFTTIASLAGTGRSYPRTYPMSYGGAISGGIVTATNDGEYPTPWTATIAGPVTNPRIENITTGDTVGFTGSLADGETLEIESDLRSVLFGNASRYSWLTAGSRWFNLAPGANQIRFAGSSGTGSMTLTYRSAWI